MDPGSIGLSHPRVSSIVPNMDYGRFVSDFVRLNFDIVLAPLIDHPFNRGKSDVKWLEAGFCAIPGVFENLPPYSGSIEHGETGFLAGSESDWEDALAALIDDPALRQRIGGAARERILRDRMLVTRSGDRLASIDALFGI
jgi:hypothetical protein